MNKSPPLLSVPRLHLRYGLVLVALLAFAPPSGLAQGDEPATEIVNALERLEVALQHEPGLTQETKDALRGFIQALRAERAGGTAAPPRSVAQPGAAPESEIAEAVDEYLSSHPPAREEPPWEGVMQRLTAYGDFRLRAESSFKLGDTPDRHSQRVRFRVGANYQLTDELLFGGRLITGDPADPQSSHQTLGNVFHSFTTSLDRAFVTYRPEWARGGWVTAGKFSHPFSQNPVYTELLWDADVQPEGVVGGYTFSKAGPLENLAFSAGRYLLLEQSRADDGFASVFHVSAARRVAEHLSANFATSYYSYSSVTPGGSRALFSENSGNATLDEDGDGKPDKFQSEFGIVNPIIAFTYDKWEFPLTISAEYILNTRARIEEDQGWAAGASIGRAQRKGDWRLYYQWQVIEQDAVFSPVSQDDFVFQTNHRSHLFGVNRQVTNNIGLHLWTLISARDKTFSSPTTGSDQNQWRLRLDMNARF